MVYEPKSSLSCWSSLTCLCILSPTIPYPSPLLKPYMNVFCSLMGLFNYLKTCVEHHWHNFSTKHAQPAPGFELGHGRCTVQRYAKLTRYQFWTKGLRALAYFGLAPGTSVTAIRRLPHQLGSCLFHRNQRLHTHGMELSKPPPAG